MSEAAPGPAGVPAEALVVAERATPGRRRLRRFVSQPTGLIALGVLLALYVGAFAAPLVYRVSPVATNPLDALLGMGPGHPLGTDELGRDELARLIGGGQISLVIGVVAMAVTVLLGTLVGMVAAFYQGSIEMVLMRLVDAWLAVPALILILVEVTTFGNSPAVIIVVIGLTYWPQVARIIHGETLSLKRREYVEASRAMGAGSFRLMVGHILPHLVPSMVVSGTLAVAWSILTESALSFLGLGIQPPLASWGAMLQDAQSYVYLDPLLAIAPGVLIVITVLAFNVLGNALRDVL
jgi:peptide/nickel transport system permease protein